METKSRLTEPCVVDIKALTCSSLIMALSLVSVEPLSLAIKVMEAGKVKVFVITISIIPLSVG